MWYSMQKQLYHRRTILTRNQHNPFLNAQNFKQAEPSLYLIHDLKNETTCQRGVRDEYAI